MDKFLGSVDDQSIETMHIMGNGWIYAFFIIVHSFLLPAGWSVGKCGEFKDHGSHQAEDEAAPAAERAIAPQGNRHEVRWRQFHAPSTKPLHPVRKQYQ